VSWILPPILPRRGPMKIIEVEYRELVSEGFNNVAIGGRAQVEEGETPEGVILRLKSWVKNELQNRESLTHHQKWEIAKEMVSKMVDEIPF
jgi:hypothetical protein